LGPDTTRRWLTTGSAVSSLPQFSPDGRMVAFVQGDPGSTNVFVVGTDSGPATQLTFLRDRQVTSLAWSPSGRLIAHCTVGEAAPRVGIVSLAGTPVANPTTALLSGLCHVAWGTDTELLYERIGNRNFGVLTLSGGSEGPLVNNDSVGWMFGPRVDASGDHIVVAWNRVDGAGWWVISRRDSSQRRLITGFQKQVVRWASDGRTLFVADGARVLRLNVSRPDSLEALAFPACAGAVPDVAPDGSLMVCLDIQETADAWLIRNFDPAARPASTPGRR
jgi:hypothetical protein